MSTTISGSTGIDKVVPNTEVQQIGVNQTWQLAELTDTGATFTDGTPSYRVVSTIYTNNSGKPISVSVTGTPVTSTTSGFVIYVDGVRVSGGGGGAVGIEAWQCYAIIPNGATYQVFNNSGTCTLVRWAELR